LKPKLGGDLAFFKAVGARLLDLHPTSKSMIIRLEPL
jgi:hypothetical protein